MMGMGIHGLIHALRFRLTLHADRIEVRGGSEERVLARDDILERGVNTDSPSSIVLTPKEDGALPFEIARVFTPDQAFLSWFEGLPNPEAEKAKKSADETLENSDFGATKTQRAEALAGARKRAMALNWITLGVCAWTLFDPERLGLTLSMLMVLP